MALGGHGLEGTGASATIVAQADLVICVGTRLTDFITGSQSCFQHPGVRFVSINVCGHDAYKQAALPILADAREALRALNQAAAGAGIRPRPAYRDEVAAARRAWAEKMQSEVYTHHEGEAMSQGELIGVLNGEARAGDTVIGAAGGPPGDLLKLWDATGGRDCHIEFGYSCMGYEIPAGLGVRLAQPEGEVYVLIGDGTYLMNPTEIVTAVQEGLKLTIVLAENHGYQCIRRLQMWRTGVSFGNEFRRRDPETNRLEGGYLPIDLAANAASFGARTWHVETPAQLRQALHEALRRAADLCDRCRSREAPVPAGWWSVVGRGSGRGQPGRQDPRATGGVRTRSPAGPAVLLLKKTPGIEHEINEIHEKLVVSYAI